MKIGNLTLNGVAALAPMAGATDRPFRELCCSYGSADLLPILLRLLCHHRTGRKVTVRSVY